MSTLKTYERMDQDANYLTQQQELILLGCLEVAVRNGSSFTVEEPKRLEQAMGWMDGDAWRTLNSIQEEGKLVDLEWVQNIRAIRFRLP